MIAFDVLLKHHFFHDHYMHVLCLKNHDNYKRSYYHDYKKQCATAFVRNSYVLIIMTHRISLVTNGNIK